jgi:hypothetical protein
VYRAFDPGTLRTTPLAARPSKVTVSQFARPVEPGGSVAKWLAGLPDLLAGADLRAVVTALRAARDRRAPILWGLGGHVIKTGLAPVLIGLMREGYVGGLALNGAALIHDFEIALAGHTSEDVDAALGPGTFGMAEETGAWLNGAINEGVVAGQGIGQAVTGWLRQRATAPHAASSVLCAAAALDVPVTVHLAIGTDITHMHPAASGAALGEGTLRDFRYFTDTVSRLAGGVYLNCGSAVILPEVFLKAVALVRNAGLPLDGLTTVSLDFIRHYRPQTNVVQRPVRGIGRGYSLVGHHEILIPLIAAAVLDVDD